MRSATPPATGADSERCYVRRRVEARDEMQQAGQARRPANCSGRLPPRLAERYADEPVCNDAKPLVLRTRARRKTCAYC